jgi:GT2 family glycosyltransferase
LTDISVHIVTHNSASTIQMCLDSLQRQGFKDYQVQVFDNASSDETCRIITAANIPLIESRENLGYALAHNRLIDQTKSTYVLTLNPDVYLLPDFLDTMKNTLDKNQRIGSAAGQLRRVESLGDPPRVMDSAGLAMRRNRRQQLLGDSTAIQAYTTPASPIFGPDGAAAFYRRAMLEDIRVMGEVFDSDFFLHKEDIDVCWRAQLRGWQSVYNPDAVAHHIRTFRIGKRANVPSDLRCLAVRNRYLLMIKNEIPAHFMRDLPRILAYDVGILLYICLRERTSLAAYSTLWSLRKRMFKKRQIVQSQKLVQWQEMAQWFRS